MSDCVVAVGESWCVICVRSVVCYWDLILLVFFRFPYGFGGLNCHQHLIHQKRVDRSHHVDEFCVGLVPLSL